MIEQKTRTRLKEFQAENPDIWEAYTQAMGFTGRQVPENGTGDCDDLSAFTGSGNFDDNWDVWSEISEVIEDSQVDELIESLERFISQVKERRPQLWEQISGSRKLRQQFAADFHFTRNGHGVGYGVGFWDGDWETGICVDDAGQFLLDLSEPFGICELEVCRLNNDPDERISSVYLCH